MYITHCPECDTAFKITDQQLSLANGWARCGRCGAVFDAVPQINAAQAHAQPEAVSPVLQEPIPKPLLAKPAPAQAQEPFERFWLSASAVLIVMLCWQFILLQRDRMAAEEPALKPVLQAMCLPFFCEVNWPRQTDYVKIENTSFNENAGDGFVMQLRIKNTELYPVGTPNLELTLTDLRDEAVIRRVFTPKEMGISDHLGPLRDAKVQLNFKLAADFKVRVAGFRVIIFYP